LLPLLTPEVKEPASLRCIDRSLIDPELPPATDRLFIISASKPRSSSLLSVAAA